LSVPYGDERKTRLQQEQPFPLLLAGGNGTELEFFINTKAWRRWARFQAIVSKTVAARDMTAKYDAVNRCLAGLASDPAQAFGIMVPAKASMLPKHEAKSPSRRFTTCVRSSVTSYCGRFSESAFNYMASVRSKR
jgi:hypothetical protein